MTQNPTSTASAEALAKQFQVSELEPRLENLWAGQEPEIAEPVVDCSPNGR